MRRDDFDESILVAIIDKNYVEPQESDDWVEDWNPTPEEIEEIMEIRRQNEIARLTEAGFIDPETGDFTPDYYRESDFAYDCQREQR